MSPLLIAGLSGDSVRFEKWVDGFRGEKWIDIPEGDYTEIKIDPNHDMPERFRLNNNIRTSGLFPKSDPVLLQMLSGIEDPEKISLMYIPLLNWNRVNGLMAGSSICMKRSILIVSLFSQTHFYPDRSLSRKGDWYHR